MPGFVPGYGRHSVNVCWMHKWFTKFYPVTYLGEGRG